MLPIYHKDGKPMIKAFDVHQYIPKSSPWAQQAPYVGGELAAMTNMTPFTRGQYVPVRTRMQHKGATYAQTVEGSRSSSRQMYTRPKDRLSSRDVTPFGVFDPSIIGAQVAQTVTDASASAQEAGQAAGKADTGKPWYEVLTDVIGAAGEAAPGIISAVKGTSQQPTPTPVPMPTVTGGGYSQSKPSGGIPWFAIGAGVLGLAAVGTIAYVALAPSKGSAGVKDDDDDGLDDIELLEDRLEKIKAKARARMKPKKTLNPRRRRRSRK